MLEGVILMTAMPPTKGHTQLINFAHEYMRGLGGTLIVILCSRSQEPIPGKIRYAALIEHYWPTLTNEYPLDLNIIHHEGDTDPQSPEDHIDFWGFWRDTIRHYVPGIEGGFVFASEAYGKQLAKAVGCEFIPYDVNRQTLNIKATNFRKSPSQYWDDIIPEIKPFFKSTFTIFGAESTGKTTVSKTLGNALITVVPEWARDYLELTGPVLNDAKMEAIVRGQYAAQVTAGKNPDSMITIQDTDLLSTIGYYDIYAGRKPVILEKMFRKTPSDLYFVMHSNIPFELDILRYGGDKRESTDQFWIDLLEKYGQKYYLVKHTDPKDQTREIRDVIYAHQEKKFETMRNFVRT